MHAAVIAIGSAVGIQVHILPGRLVQQGEVAGDALGNPQVKGCPIVAVAIAVAIFAMLGDNRWRKLPVFAQR